jgi:soluble lytic murein transglycosylase
MRSSSKKQQPIFLGLVFVICMILVGCADAPPTPTPLQPTATATAQPISRQPTRSTTATTAPTATYTPTPTSSPTPSPTPTATDTPTPTLTPSPTPQPNALLETGRHHQTNGEYDLAIEAYLNLIDQGATPDQVREARYSLAEAYLQNRDYVLSASAWEDFIASYPDDVRLPQAALMAARAYDAANECVKAVPHYQTYLARDVVLADMVHEWIGDCLATEERLEEAIVSYRHALDASDDASVQVSLREKIAGIYRSEQKYDDAVAEYDAILAIARIESYRAKIEYLAGQTLAAAGQTQAAQVRYRRAVDRYPEAEYAYLSLIELVEAGVEVDEFQRGLVDYHAGAAYPDAYGAAIRAFDRYLASEPEASESKIDEALYRKALAQRALDQPEEALQTLEALIVGYPESSWHPQAWLEKGATYLSMGDNDRAVKTYQDVAAFFPAEELAPEALWRAARVREREGANAEAAALYKQLQTTFPAYEDADAALWRAGLVLYQAGESSGAIVHWQALLEGYPRSPFASKTRYWLGKLDAEPLAGESASYWDQLLAGDSFEYYALRVEQIRTGQSLTATRFITAALEPPAWDVSQTATALSSWLQEWTDVPTGTNLSILPVSLTQRLDFRRGEALLATGLRSEALDTFNDALSAMSKDPLVLTSLSLYFKEKGLHGMAARSTYQLVRLWPGGAIHDSPLALQQLAYPLAYADLLSREAQAHGLDPLLLAALVRQESLFEPAAESYAGARGLGQVMPATGEGIARSLNMDGFVLADLYRPWVSIRFGAYYLSVQLDRFDNHLLVALAAYNGGPGNTLRWLEAGGDDLDLFIELITASQSRLYLQQVFEQYAIYESLYRPSEREKP